MSLSQQGSSRKDPKRVEFTFTHGFGHVSGVAFTICGNPNKVVSRGNSSQPIFKKGGFTPVLSNHKNGISSLKRAFLGEI